MNSLVLSVSFAGGAWEQDSLWKEIYCWVLKLLGNPGSIDANDLANCANASIGNLNRKAKKMPLADENIRESE